MPVLPVLPRSPPGSRNSGSQGKIGARLLLFANNWKSLGAEPWIVQVVSEGYKIPFLLPPPLSVSPVALTAYQPGSERFRALEEEVTALIEKGAIVPVSDSVPAFYNRLFVVPKATGGWRPVLDVSRLNKFVDLTSFSMESSRSVLNAIRQGDFLLTTDMKDGYFHIPIHQESQKFLRFVFQGKVFQFRALPFGLSTAPQVFTRVIAFLGRLLRLRGVRVILYLDDWLLLAGTIKEALRAKRILLELTDTLGIVLNLQKSCLDPAQVRTYLRMIIDKVGV